MRNRPPKYIPTQEEIRRMCHEIQAGWDAEEELRRRAYKSPEFYQAVIREYRVPVPTDKSPYFYSPKNGSIQ